MRKKHTGQPLDHLFRKLNNATQAHQIIELIGQAKAFKPRSNYEIKDKSNLLEQLNGMLYFMGGIKQ